MKGRRGAAVVEWAILFPLVMAMVIAVVRTALSGMREIAALHETLQAERAHRYGGSSGGETPCDADR